MAKISNLKHLSGSDIVCLEVNGARPFHKGNGWCEWGNVPMIIEVRYTMIVIRKRFSDVRIYETEISPTLEADMGTGGATCRLF